MFENFESFIYSSYKNFPKEECIVQNKNESNVFDAQSKYLVLYINTSFPTEKYMKYATPYICKENSGKITYGWSTENNEVFGNVENTCQMWDEFVIGFKKVDENYINKDREEFEFYRHIIESQYE